MAMRHLGFVREAATLVLWDKKKLSKLERKRLDQKLLDVSFRHGFFTAAALLDSMEKMRALMGKRRLGPFISGFGPCIGQ
jgi:hypothetical protein